MTHSGKKSVSKVKHLNTYQQPTNIIDIYE